MLWTVARTSVIVLCVSFFSAAITAAAEPPAEVGQTELKAEDVKAQVLKWIDEYREVQVLFHDEDIAKLRAELADDTPEEAMRWWEKTAEIRAALESPEWKATREWFREFLKVQAIFTDQEIAELRDQAMDTAQQGKPREFKEILAEIEKYRANLVRSAANDRAIREQRVQVIRAYRQDEVTQRSSAARAAAFGTDTNQPTIRRRSARYSSGPLIDSLDVARWSAMRGFWRY